MSRLFGPTVPLLQYQGQSLDIPVQQCRVPAQEPKVVRIDINWADYWPVTHPADLGIIVNLFGNTPETAKMDRLVSIKIDNVGSTVPIYVQFQDSLDIVTAPPNTAVIMPIMTNGGQFKVFARGLTAGFIPRTSIYVANFMMVANVDPEIQLVFPQYLGSPTVQRANALTPGFGPPALGDNVQSGYLFLNAAGPPAIQTAVLLPAVPAGGFYYITALKFQLLRASILWNAAGNHFFEYDVSFVDLNLNFTIMPMSILGNQPTAGLLIDVFNVPLCEISGLNFRLDASHAYGLNFFSFVEAGGGVITQSAVYVGQFCAFTYSLT